MWSILDGTYPVEPSIHARRTSGSQLKMADLFDFFVIDVVLFDK
jgi:hypothetical protein